MGKLKKRKTRKEKVLADLHRKLYKVNIATPIAKENIISIKENIVNNNPTASVGTSGYPYLLKDLTTTGIVTGIILVSQFFLFLILKFHIITLSGINY